MVWPSQNPDPMSVRGPAYLLGRPGADGEYLMVAGADANADGGDAGCCRECLCCVDAR